MDCEIDGLKNIMKRRSSYYSAWDNVIPHQTCQDIINLGEGEWNQAQIGGENDSENLNDIRKSDIVWINEQWVYDLIFPYMMDANEQGGWKYDIKAAESCQITRYTKDGFYNWHNDGIGSHNETYNEPDNEFLHGNARKLSMSIILNSNYEGGDLEIKGLDNKLSKLKEGSIIVFPSFLEHRVAPVTKGTRYSLVAWFVGPAFR